MTTRRGTMNNRIVARYKDGRLIKGISHDIQPTRPAFHIRTEDGKSLKINMAELKAVFYVRTLEGNSTHNENLTPDPEDARSRGSSVVVLKFLDGENMVGLANALPGNKPYFFVVPVDPHSNNVRILVNQAALISVEMPNGEQALSRAS